MKLGAKMDNELLKYLQDAAQTAANRVRSRDDAIAGLWKRLGTVQEQPDLFERIKTAQQAHWAGAVPTNEGAGEAFIVDVDAAMPVAAVDGSQVAPEYDAPVVWAYAQAVAVLMGKPVSIRKSTFLSEDDLEKYRMSPGIIDAVRGCLEMQVAARAASSYPDHVVLTDGGLLPWMSDQPTLLDEYTRHLESCDGKSVAAVISGPRSRLLINLIRLADASNPSDMQHERKGVKDIHLMNYGLNPGQRSAVFRHGSPRNDRFLERKAGICFFFLKITAHEIARIEIPEWVAIDTQVVNEVAASVLSDSQALQGYSYLLAQAHNQVVIRGDQAKALREFAEREFISKGGRIWYSAKTKFKNA